MTNYDEMIKGFGIDMSKFLNAIKNMKLLADDQKHKNTESTKCWDPGIQDPEEGLESDEG